MNTSLSAYKRAIYQVETDQHAVVEVICFHKAANLLRVGDRVSIQGGMMRGGRETRLVQLLSVPDNIVWFSKGK